MASISKNIILLDDGVTKLGGRNIGKYPLHHFIHHKSSAGEPGWPLKLISTGEDEWIDGAYRFRKNSSVFAIEFVTEGGFLFVQEGRSYNIVPGNVFFVHLGKDNEMSTGGIPYSRKRTMIVTGTSLRGILAALGLDRHDFIKPRDLKRTHELFSRAEEVFRAARPGFMREASAIVYETLLFLADGLKFSEFPETLQTGLAFLEENIDRRVSMKELCRHCSCSPMTLLRLFKRYLKSSPTEYFIGMKMELAKEMLTLTSKPVKEISRQLGYSSQLHFSSEFSKRVGLPPTKYRRTPKLIA
ncbi:MAG: hypothetical protein A2X49_09555 [Lentisphaerae bacterium GWF2_52_8]|nr:MAG: hypothetical protein A2X49_09555 [Lentisphaerae bacterium GWF2_52_8]